ncbi:hypothetical protein [Rhizobium rhizogenes]|nr:hypothetical protein [Rhizobium rhizogenes]
MDVDRMADQTDAPGLNPKNSEWLVALTKNCWLAASWQYGQRL